MNRPRGHRGVLGSAVVAWPLTARAQQAMSLWVFFIFPRRRTMRRSFRRFRKGLRESRYVAGRNAA